MIECNKIECDIKKSINLMNVSIINTVIFVAWLVYKDLFYDRGDKKVERLEISDMLNFSLFMTASIFLPVMGTLNTAVSSETVINDNTKEKLTHLKLNVQLLQAQAASPDVYDPFLDDIANING
jgi:hypothetical protein